MNWKAARASAGLSILFLVVYGATNRLASLRSDVPSVFFVWERRIPLVPLFIVPYMSIDLFFVAAPFVCRTDRERRTLVRRIAAAILVAGACFLAFPLRFAFERPHVGGWLGAIFSRFRELDQPFNQCPSLHVALCIILADLYARHVAGIARAAVLVWFGLIAVSPALTYQHHIIDLIGGLALAAACLHLFQDVPLRQPVIRNPRVGWYYLTGAATVGACAAAARPWSWFLLWPVASLLLAAAGYFRLGAGIFRKNNGRLPLTTWLMLWPVLLGQRASLAWYARRCGPWDRLTDRVWIGRVLSRSEARLAIDAGVLAVLDLTGEFSEVRPLRRLTYCQLPILDLTAPTPELLNLAVAFVADHAARGAVLVHCKIGYSRTAAVAGAYLLSTGQARHTDQALAMLRAARPSIVIRPEIVDALRAFEARTTSSG